MRGLERRRRASRTGGGGIGGGGIGGGGIGGGDAFAPTSASLGFAPTSASLAFAPTSASLASRRHRFETHERPPSLSSRGRRAAAGIAATRSPCVTPRRSRVAGGNATWPAAAAFPGSATTRTVAEGGFGASRFKTPLDATPTAARTTTSPSRSPRARAVAREMNAHDVGDADISATPVGAGSTPRSRRGHVATAPRVVCTRSTAGRIADASSSSSSRVSSRPASSSERVPNGVADAFAAGDGPLFATPTTSGTHGATRSSVSRPKRATPPGALGVTAVARRRNGPAPSARSAGQNGNVCPSAATPTWRRSPVSISAAAARTARQSSSASGATSTAVAVGAVARPITRTTSPSRTPRQSASARGTSSS